MGRTITGEWFFKTSVLITRSANSFVEVNAFITFQKKNPCKVEGGVMNVYLRSFFNIIIENALNYVNKLANYERVARTSTFPSELFYMKWRVLLAPAVEKLLRLRKRRAIYANSRSSSIYGRSWDSLTKRRWSLRKWLPRRSTNSRQLKTI